MTHHKSSVLAKTKSDYFIASNAIIRGPVGRLQLLLVIAKLQTTVGAGIPNMFKFPMVAFCLVIQWRSVFQWYSVLNKNGGHLVKNHWQLEQNNSLLFGFPMVWF